MKRPFLFFGLIAGSVFFAACNEQIYVPNTINAPLLKEKHEFKGSVSLNNYQAAYALTDHIAIMANGQYVYRFNLTNDNSDTDLFVDKHTRGGLFEGAIGFFHPMDLKKRMMFDVYAGYGNGGFRTVDVAYYSGNSSGNIEDYRLRTHFSKLFLQPSIGFVHRVFEAAFSSRLSMLNFYDQSIGTKAFENNTSDRDDFLRVGTKTRFFFEPAFTFRVGYKYVKFQTQFLLAVPIRDNTHPRYDAEQYFQQGAVDLGVSINVAQWYNEVRKKK